MKIKHRSILNSHVVVFWAFTKISCFLPIGVNLRDFFSITFPNISVTNPRLTTHSLASSAAFRRFAPRMCARGAKTCVFKIRLGRLIDYPRLFQNCLKWFYAVDGYHSPH